ncbi:MAG: glycosyltransferase family 2 protein [Phycisphaerae bacterium]|nr:glycosyltransferase family 2 protein [Phycisphaerae bacterium]MDD5381713.1 glycosyltransferase family 2 protein [Phycisphaerae bacterium]
MSYKPDIKILLATYNGQEYLAEQIDSILTQSNQDWQLLIRDDGSDDDTVRIIEGYANRLPDKIGLIKDNEGRLGANLNFGKLLQYADAEYIMFCDQDDVWLPNKIEMALNAMKAAEQVYPDKPILIHTDLKVIDSERNTIADSMWIYQKIFPEAGNDLNRVMAQNVVTGCTMMINKKARAVSIPVPDEAIMYDWWLALNVCRHGKIIYLSIPSVLYRQHSGNQVGAKKARKIDIIHFLKKLCCIKKLLSAHYRMLKKFDPRAGFCRLLLNKTLVKIAQRCR